MAEHPQLRFIRTVMGHLTDPLCLVSPDQHIIALNGAFAVHFRRRFGRPVRPGMRGEDLLTGLPHLKAWVQHYWTRALAGEPVSATEDFGPAGKLELRLYPIHDDHGNLLGALQLTRDIASRQQSQFATVSESSRQADVAQEQSPPRFAMLFETIGHGVLYFDASLHLLAANPAAHRILAVSGSDLEAAFAQDHRWKVIREDGVPLPGLLQPASMAMQTGSAVGPLVLGILHPGLEAYRWLRLTATPLFDRGVARPGQVYLIFEDITDSKQAQAATSSLEQFYQQVADCMPQLVWMASPDGFVHYHNRQWYDYTGLDFAHSRDDGWYVAVHPDDLPALKERHALARKLGQSYELEFRVRGHTDGQYRWFLERARPFRDSAGQIVRWFGTATDIHDQKLLSQTLQRTKDELERLSTARDQFLSTVSHELRTPLTAILGWTDLLRTGAIEPAEVPDVIARIEHNAQTQATLVEDMLDVSRIVNNRLGISPRLLDARKPLRAALDAAKSSADQKGITLTCHIGDEPIPTYADENRLRQVIDKLLSNAVKFTDTGGHVTLIGRIVDANLRITVTDTGRGIASSLLPHLFERFQSAGVQGRPQGAGLGLGLTIVKHLVALHGGTVSAWSEGEGKGAAFTIDLPLVSGPLPTPATREPKLHTPIPPQTVARPGTAFMTPENSPEAPQSPTHATQGVWNDEQ